MNNYLARIKEIKKRHSFLAKGEFKISKTGTHHKVFISTDFVIRFRDDNPKILLRETKLLKQLLHPLTPKVSAFGEINGLPYMVEERLPGKTLDLIWKKMAPKDKASIVSQLIDFLKYERSKRFPYFYSMRIGKKYENFLDCLIDGIDLKVARIKKFKRAENKVDDLLRIINDESRQKLFLKKGPIRLVHGDLIIHNLMAKKNRLTGILDWELAFFGDGDYDLCRLFYYQECAKAYERQGTDDSFEADFMERLVKAIKNSRIITDKKAFENKYKFIRSIFLIDALHWAACSKQPKKNLKELLDK